MRYITKTVLFDIIIWVLGFLAGISLFSLMQPELTECTDYTLNEYEVGDVPLKCIDLFLEDNA